MISTGCRIPFTVPRVRRVSALACALSVAGVVIGMFGLDSAQAGVSGPGGPRLNYDYMPRIEDYQPRPESEEKARRSPTVPYSRSEPQFPPRKHERLERPNQSEGATAQNPELPSETSEGQRRSQVHQPPDQTAKPPHAGPPSQSQPPGASRNAPSATTQPDVLPPDAGAQRNQILTRLYGYLSNAKDKGQAARLATSIERLWLHSGSPTTDILMKRTDRAIETGRWSAAETFAEAVVKLQPDYTEGWMRRALILFQRRQPTRALRSLRRVLEIEPNHFVALDRVGAILENVGEHKPALKAYRKLKRLHPQAPGVDERIEELTRKVEGEQI